MAQSLFDRIGHDVSSCKNDINAVFETAKLDWTVKQVPMEYANNTHNRLVVNYREDTNQFLGIVHNKKYKLLDNMEVFGFLHYMPDIMIDKAGATSDSKRVWVSCALNEGITIRMGDDIKFYLVFVHDYTGRSGLKLILTPLRTVCSNMLNYIYNHASFKYSITHMGDMKKKLAEMHNIFKLISTYKSALSRSIQKQLEVKITDNDAEEIVNVLFAFSPIGFDKDRINNNESSRISKYFAVNDVLDLYYNKSDLEPYRNTGFGIISAVSDYVSHPVPKKQQRGYYERNFLDVIEGSRLISEAQRLIGV
jgi:phage/plasmid-like protein (TIGR03299 family)